MLHDNLIITHLPPSHGVMKFMDEPQCRDSIDTITGLSEVREFLENLGKSGNLKEGLEKSGNLKEGLESQGILLFL